jgi:signal transduction histidine kinase
MALMDENRNILDWRSQFEGYLPISQKQAGQKDSWIIDSPVGKIYNVFSSFTTPDGKTYFLYLGYSLSNLQEMIGQSRRTFVIIFSVLILSAVAFFFGLYRVQTGYLEKQREAEKEKKEKERFREISGFTSGVAHEIKNPLNSLSLLFELMQKKAPDELRQSLSLGKQEIQKIASIIDRFSATIKPLRLNKQSFSLAELIGDIRRSISQEAKQKNVIISFDASNPLSITADKDLLGQALLNILKNSLEASQKGEISIRTAAHRKTNSITIEDCGQGIESKDQKYIFDPFFTKKEHGMGIGLYLTKKIIEAHGGSISLKSERGRGTTFTIQLPGGMK